MRIPCVGRAGPERETDASPFLVKPGQGFETRLRVGGESGPQQRSDGAGRARDACLAAALLWLGVSVEEGVGRGSRSPIQPLFGEGRREKVRTLYVGKQMSQGN